MPAPVRLLVAVFIALSGPGCGYQLGWRAPPSVRTIAVPIFNNATFPLRRDVEYDLTSALRREIQTRTPLKLVDAREADMAVIGTITDFRERVVAEDRGDEPLESNLSITVELIIEDYVHRTSRRETIRESQPFSSSGGEPLEVARERAITNLAEKILVAVESW